MIVTDDSNGAKVSAPQGQSIIVGPPSRSDFQKGAEHIVLDFANNENVSNSEDLPPEFTPYQADFSIAKNGWIISHDPHLNEDGEALYRFILSHASAAPSYLLHCRGTHNETRTHTIPPTNKQGRERVETYTETIVDFDFKVDIGRNIPASSTVVHWSVPDSEPAYRGKMVREVELKPNEALFLRKHRGKATLSEVTQFKALRKERREKGLPPWHGNNNAMALHDNGGLRSSKTLRSWADEYCASKKYLKEFTYEKVVYGWNFDALKSAIRATIVSTSYTGQITVSFECTANKICVRSDNTLSRTLSNSWLKLLMIITFVYPFIWLFKRFHSKGGGRWEVCGGAYGLKYSPVPLPADGRDSEPKKALQDQQTGDSSASGSTTSSMMMGLKEGQWLRQWERSIKHAVASRLQDSVPLTEPQIYELPNNVALSLDGYTD